MSRIQLFHEAERLRDELKRLQRDRAQLADVPLGSLRRPWAASRTRYRNVYPTRSLQYLLRKSFLLAAGDRYVTQVAAAELAVRFAIPTDEVTADGRVRARCPFCGYGGSLGGFVEEGLRRHAGPDCQAVSELIREFSAEYRRVPDLPGGSTCSSPTSPSRPGYVYLIRCTASGRVKIGLSVDPKARLRQLQLASGSTLELVATRETRDMASEESALHQRFSGRRLHGEWFTPHPDILAAFGVAA